MQLDLMAVFVAASLAAGCHRGSAVSVANRPLNHPIDRVGSDALPNAVGSAKDEEVKKMVLAGEPIDATDYLGKTALYHAVVNNDSPLTTFLLDHGANPNFAVTSKAGETPLFAAIHHRNLEGMGILLRRGADPNATTISGYTAIFEAAEAGWLEAVQLLLDHGANAAAVSRVSTTALSVTNPNHIDTTVPEDALIAVDKVLLANGADPSLRDRDGHTAGERARSMGYTRVADMLDHFVPPAGGTTKPSAGK